MSCLLSLTARREPAKRVAWRLLGVAPEGTVGADFRPKQEGVYVVAHHYSQ